MTSVDSYLGEVSRGLRGMDVAVRKDILRELRSHLVESLAANGGNVSAAVAATGEPRAVARRYRDLYGFGVTYRAMFVAIAGVLAVFTVPVLTATDEFLFPLYLSTPFLVADIAFLIWVSVVAGNRAGLVAGTAGCAGRLAAFGGAYLVSTAPLIRFEGLTLFALVSALMVVIGWAPGRARRAWRRPSADL
ncbi:MAG TPA: hypothetical protein VIL58_06785 [Thermoplasmata archaeon]